MIDVSFRKKMTAIELYWMRNWVELTRLEKVTHEPNIQHTDGTRTVTVRFASERDAVIFKLRYA